MLLFLHVSKQTLRVVDRSLCKYVIRNDLCATKGIKNTVSFCILNPFIQGSNAENKPS